MNKFGMNKFNIVVFISGRGSNLKSLIENARSYQVVGVISDNPEALGLSFASDNSISTKAFSRSNFRSRKELRCKMYSEAREFKPDLIALAGFMQIVDAEFVSEFYGQLVNIHPSLLPEFPGLNTHQQVLDSQAQKHGCTVHYVDSGVDTGPIIAQATCQRLPTDTVETLSSRVLALEHMLYPWVVNNIATGRICLEDRKVRYDSQLANESIQHNFILST